MQTSSRISTRSQSSVSERITTVESVSVDVSQDLIRLDDHAKIKEMAIKAEIHPEQTDLSPGEMQLRTTAVHLANQSADDFDDFLAGMQRDINDLVQKGMELDKSLDSKVTLTSSLDTQDVVDHVISNVQAELEHREPAIEAKEKLIRAERQWLQFKMENDLTHREAKYPDEKYIHFSLIIGIAVIETILNAAFYQNEAGLLGGAFMALGISIVNLLISVCLGWGFRYHNLKINSFKKYMGLFSVFVFVLFAVWFNGVLAAFRLEYQQVVDPGNIGEMTRAFQNSLSTAGGIFLLKTPFRDMMSFILFFVGVACSLLAFYKGYTLDDAYPGYSEKDKLYKQLKRAYDFEISQVVPDKTIAKLVSQLEDISRQTSALQVANLRDILKQRKEALNNQQEKIGFLYKSAIEAFRKHHLSVIPSGVKAPQYFGDYSDIKINFRSVSMVVAESKLEELDALKAKLEKRVNLVVIPTVRLINMKKPQIALEAKRQFIRDVENEASRRAFPNKLDSQDGFHG